jgi:hypothetical protein
VAAPLGGRVALSIFIVCAANQGAVRAEQAPTILVGSTRGLEAWDLNGTRTVMSAGFARHPRWIPDRSAVLAITGRSLVDGKAKVERIQLATGKRRRVATLPSFSCGEAAGEEILKPSLQSASDFRVDRGGKFACLTLMDRNLNMASLVLDVRVDLSSGRTERELLGPVDGCTPPSDVVADDKGESRVDCEPVTVREAAPPASAQPFGYEAGGRIIDGRTPSALRVRALRDFSPGPVSPSGRWVLLESEPEEGDYIYRDLLLFDRAQGAVFAVPTGASNRWPEALPVRKLSRSPRTARVVGEDDVRWLDLEPQADVLVVGDLIILPGERSFRVRGDVVR